MKTTGGAMSESKQADLFPEDSPRDPGRLMWHGRPRRTQRSGEPKNAQEFAERVRLILRAFEPTHGLRPKGERP